MTGVSVGLDYPVTSFIYSMAHWQPGEPIINSPRCAIFSQAKVFDYYASTLAIAYVGLWREKMRVREAGREHAQCHQRSIM